ncbi:DnaJ domain-containing protein [Halobellus rufus]|uniref:DnaJ domain-containing protein n=1 Tax=Halobellus rufus TaxID=1448860 RepID=UPI0006792C96|nr:DnaJ domain-containing protein [Halobellus rufus]
MDEDGLVIGLTAVLAGTTVLFVVLGFAYQPLLLLFATIFGAATYLLWYHASGRLGERVRRTAANAERGRRRRATAAGRGPRDFQGFGPGRRASAGGQRRQRREAAGERRRSGGARGDPNEPTLAEAYRTLGLDADADDAAVKAAYRERVKTTHPDTDGGDEEQFKRVNRAYERIRE